MSGERREDVGEAGRAGDSAPGVQRGEADARRLLHELEGYRVELELQSDELCASRVEADGALRRYAELFEVAPVGYLVVAADGEIRDLNPSAARILGAEAHGLLGRRLGTLVARGDADGLARLLAAAALGEARAADGCELRVPRSAEAVAHVHVAATPLADQAGAVLVAAEDVTARRLAERALQEESRRKDDFLAALSHELRNPLAPIRNGLALLARATPGSEQAARALRVVERQVAHLSRLVDDLLDVTRIARGKIRLRREPVELGALVQRTAEDHRATFDEAGVALQVSLPRHACWVDVDATRIAQVLGNLLANAATFTAPGGRVDVTVRRGDGAATIAIRDTGVGIAPEIRDRLFEPFAQAPQTIARTRGGLGLGLATVKGLVELHGGMVTLASAGPGRGAEFTVRLPLGGAPARPAAATAAAGAGRGRRVLVVEDNEDGATTLREILELAGHEVQVALDGPRAVAVARAFAPEVVLCDIGLPGMDGYGVARALRGDAATRGAFLVALSGYALPDDLRRAEEAGFDRHLAKPLGVDALTRALEDARRARPAAGPAEPERPPGASV